MHVARKNVEEQTASVARNKILGFIFAVVGVLGVFLTIGIWVYDDFIKPKTVVPARNTGNATTSGPNSPAVSGDGNNVTYC